MTRKIIEDIVSRPRQNKEWEEDEGEIEEEVVSYKEPKRRGGKSFLFILAGSILVLGAFFVLSSTYSRVSIKVTTTNKVINLDELVFLNTDGAGGGIRYEVMSFKDTETVDVPITGSKTIQRPAVGVVTIYNSYSNKAQSLVAGTRLETKDGKIFKLEKSVVVPGTSVSGGKTIPGSVTVSVKASQGGPSYNIPPSDFTIPGFKGTAKYTKFYAKSTKAMTDGFSGEIKTTSPEDLKQARLKTEEGLRQRLTKNALVQVPDGFILYEDGIFFSFTDNATDDGSLIGTDDGGMKLETVGVFNAVIVNREDLKNFIISMKLTGLNKSDKVIITDLDKINFKIVNKDKVNLDDTGSVMVKIAGDVSAFWDFDENLLRENLAGVRKSKYQEVLVQFPVIEKSEAGFNPSWAFYFPSDISRIEIDKGF